MKHIRLVVICSLLALLALSSGPLASLSSVRPAAAQERPYTCQELASQGLSDTYNGLFRRFDALAGQTITVTATPAETTPETSIMNMLVWLSGAGSAVFDDTIPVPGSLTYTFPTDGEYEVNWWAGGEGEYDLNWVVTFTCGQKATAPALPAPPPPAPGPDLCSMPAGSVVGTFPVEVLLYYAPKEGAVSTVKMKAGQSLWVTGMDKTQSFYQVLLVCQKLWIPASEIGPTPGYPWYGKMLPMTIIE